MFEKILAGAITVSAAYLFIRAIIRSIRIKRTTGEWPEDPVQHCQVYNTIGCAHVDGPLCDMHNCNIEVTIQFRPRFQRVLDINAISGDTK